MHAWLTLSVLRYPPIDPVLFHLGPFAVRWYGLAYVLGFLFAYWWLQRLARIGVLRMPVERVGDLVSWAVIGVLLGGRLGWWVFYHHNIRGPEPWYEPIAAWHGGMSFHGALIGITIVLILCSWHYHINIWNLLDACVLVAPLGLFFGRIANFINAELVGRPSDLPWAIIFPGDTVARHPSQLYEALLEGPILLGVLWGLRRLGLRRDGQVAAIFLIAYGVFRFLVEFTREPDVQLGFIAFGWLTMGQLLSLFLVLAGLILLILRSGLGKDSGEPRPAPRR